jgi:hypothetical protein
MDTALTSTTDAARSGAYTRRDLPVMTAARRMPMLRHGWLRLLAGAASVPGGIPPGRSRPEPPADGS